MLIDLHNHTGWGSGCSHLEPAVLVEQARAWGLDGVAITEHNQLWDPRKVDMLRRRHDFVIVAGVEVDTDVGHVLAFGFEGPRRFNQLPSLEELREMVDEVDGVLVLAHPFRDTRVTKLNGSLKAGEPGLERFRIVDAIETYNGIGGGGERAADLARILDKTTTGGSDTHRFMDVASCFTVFEEEIRDERDLIGAIKAGRCRGGDWESEGLANKRIEDLTSPGRTTPISATRGA